MGIEVHQIHNLVRTYQRALQPTASERTRDDAPARQEDRVSVSPEARQRHHQKSSSHDESKPPTRHR